MLRIRRPYDPYHLGSKGATPALVSSKASSFPSRRTQGVWRKVSIKNTRVLSFSEQRGKGRERRKTKEEEEEMILN